MTEDPLDLAAAELALNLLEGEDRAEAFGRMLADPMFAADVAAWRARFAAMFDAWPDALPDPGLVDRIVAGLDMRPPVRPRVAAPGFPWRFASAALGAIAATLLALLIVRPPDVRRVAMPVAVAAAAQPPGPLVVASLESRDRPIPAVFDPRSGALRVAAAPDVAAAKVAELWVIGADGVPHALALLDSSGGMLRPDRASRLRLAPGGVLAISVEPIGGSPTGQPTGPVIAKGALALV